MGGCKEWGGGDPAANLSQRVQATGDQSQVCPWPGFPRPSPASQPAGGAGREWGKWPHPQPSTSLLFSLPKLKQLLPPPTCCTPPPPVFPATPHRPPAARGTIGVTANRNSQPLASFLKPENGEPRSGLGTWVLHSPS